MGDWPATALSGHDATVSLSRRDLVAPYYRITRSWKWSGDLNPWKQKDQLPLFDRGLLGDLLYANEPRIIDDLSLVADDPAVEHLAGFGSLAFVPMFDRGEAINAVADAPSRPQGVRPRTIPRDGLADQPLRAGDAQPCAAGGSSAKCSTKWSESCALWPHPAPAASVGGAPDPHARHGGALPDGAAGGGRLLRLLPSSDGRWASSSRTWRGMGRPRRS